MKKQKTKKKITDQAKLVKGLKLLVVLCIAIIVCELAFIGLKIYKRQQATVYVDTFAKVLKIKNGYLGVGSSDFKHSSYNTYSKYQKAKLMKYNNNHKLVFESAYTKGYQSYFNDVIETKNNYIAVGAMQSSKDQVDDNSTDGLIVVYDKNGKQVNSKKIQIAGDTVLTKIVEVDDGSIVVGQSILENMVIGTDPNGGAIIIKYDKDFKEIWKSNYGGSKSAIYNDIVVDDDAIYVVGKDATRYGIFVKYDTNGNREFVKTYEYTDTIGFSAIQKIENDYIVVGGKTTNIDAEDKDKKTEAVILKYNKEGKILFEKTIAKNNQARFNNVIVDEDEIIAVGHTYKKDEKESSKTLNVFRYSGILAKYDKDGKAIYVKEETGSRDTYFSDLIIEDNMYLVVGQTSSKELGGNNKDLKNYFLYYNKDGEKKKYFS